MVVGILGCGPAGLFAAQAVTLHGFQPVIISKKIKSEIYGAQYLHRPIPGVSNTRPDGYITTYRLGTPERYAERVYGLGTTPTSWEKVRPGAQPAWDLRRAYEHAWAMFEPMINDEELAGENVERYSALFDVVISTIPLWSICLKPKEHQFKSIPIFVSKTMEYTGLPDVWTKDQGSVVYNGSEHGDWYRTSYIFGHTSTEYKASRDLYDQHYFGKHRMDLGFKVAGTTCDCHPLVHKAGRMGRWERGILTHHAFEGAIEALSDVAVRRPPA